MSEFVNTVDLIGDDALTDSIISGTLTELRDDRVRTIRELAFGINASLVTIDCPNATSIGYGSFSSCATLKTANFPSVTSVAENAFHSCTSLSDVNMSSLKKTGLRSFYNCTSLKKVKFPSLTSFGGSSFEKCTSLLIADFTNINKDAFQLHSNFAGCTGLIALVLRKDSLVDLLYTTNIGNSGITAGTCYIYVPRSLVDSYKAATNWSTYADQIRALEDYTVDGTITGELDETKI